MQVAAEPLGRMEGERRGGRKVDDDHRCGGTGRLGEAVLRRPRRGTSPATTGALGRAALRKKQPTQQPVGGWGEGGGRGEEAHQMRGGGAVAADRQDLMEAT